MLGPLHGFGIARRLEQVSEGVLRLNEGTVYTALLRLGQRGWIRSTWGVSERNRKARFYSITPAGRRRLAREQKGWQQIAGIMERLMRLAPEK
jgi:transcriptional regulator